MMYVANYRMTRASTGAVIGGDGPYYRSRSKVQAEATMLRSAMNEMAQHRGVTVKTMEMERGRVSRLVVEGDGLRTEYWMTSFKPAS